MDSENSSKRGGMGTKGGRAGSSKKSLETACIEAQNLAQSSSSTCTYVKEPHAEKTIAKLIVMNAKKRRKSETKTGGFETTEEKTKRLKKAI